MTMMESRAWTKGAPSSVFVIIYGALFLWLFWAIYRRCRWSLELLSKKKLRGGLCNTGVHKYIHFFAV